MRNVLVFALFGHVKMAVIRMVVFGPIVLPGIVNDWRMLSVVVSVFGTCTPLE
jgi:hypothetical protein